MSEQNKAPLTPRQREMLDFIEGFCRFRRYAPSLEEIAQHFGYRSVATVHEHLTNLECKGYIRRTHYQRRSIELTNSLLGTEDVGIRLGAVELPLRGTVAAGEPIEAIAERETIAVPEDMISGSRDEHYVLRVRGDSMINEQIRDGDHVIVRVRRIPREGDMVIALIDNETATMKKLYREEDGYVRLQPANPALAPMIVQAHRVRVQGIVVGVLRRYG
ncbi:MAG: transcriptional repressor LexA [Gemmatimonadetes bacterium]|nr:transcriptional repressor LexA [Gemmatimonadota bacterium]